MKKILFITPVSIAGTLIINGLKEGFRQLGHQVLSFDVRKIDEECVVKFQPDLVIGYDYVHFVDDKAENIISNLKIPVVHYFADDPLSNYAHSGDLSLFDKLSNSDGIVFCWDKEYLKVFKNICYYLPLGVNPFAYEHENKEKKDSIVFVGRPLTLRRLGFICEILKTYPEKLEIYSYEKHFETSIEQIREYGLLNENQINEYKKTFKGYLKTENELADIYSKSAICLNITLNQGISSMNYRVFEVLACGGFLLTDYIEDTAREFLPDIDAVYYNDKEELLEKIDFYLNNPLLRDKVVKQGKEKLLANHSFKHRAEEILIKLSSIN